MTGREHIKRLREYIKVQEKVIEALADCATSIEDLIEPELFNHWNHDLCNLDGELLLEVLKDDWKG